MEQLVCMMTVYLGSYFAVADVIVNRIEEAVNYYDEDNLFMVVNKNNDIAGSGSGFYD